MRKFDKGWSLSGAGGALGAFALLAIAPAAYADPETPVPPPPTPDEQSISVQAAAGDPGQPIAPPAEVPHLSSPQNLPPGTTDVDPNQGHTGSYLRDLWHAMQTQEISGKDALLLLTQRPMNPHALPANGLPTGPQAPPGTPLPAGPAPAAPAPDAPPADAPPPAPAPSESPTP